MSRKCVICKNKLNIFGPSEDSRVLPLKYMQWQKMAESRIDKVEIASTLGEVFEELDNQLKSFLTHTYIKRNQAKAFEQIKSNVDGKEILVQVDFSENASLMHQNEVQSAHWSHSQVTLFTAYSWIANGVNESIVVVSDDLDHTKLRVYAYMCQILQYLTEKFPNVKVINIFSDGAASQFKQRYLFSVLHMLENDFNVKIKWHFFATSHGKGVVDGIGGTVKRAVWRQVKTGRVIVSTAEHFATVAKESSPSIYIIYVSKADINLGKDALESHWENTLAVPNCLTIHEVVPHGKHYLIISETSMSIQKKKVLIHNAELDNSSNDEDEDLNNEHNNTHILLPYIEHISVYDWVLVNYDGKHFPGHVTFVNIVTDEYEVNVMHLSATKNYYKWPSTEDKIMYNRQHIIRKIVEPSPLGNRGQYTFDNEIF